MKTTIKMVEITNFRNIDHLVLMLNDGASIITGKNKLGKSNVLNAINWLITDTLLTDKYGVGENDIDSIVPITHKVGEHTSVSITINTGKVYTKIYKVTYTSNGSKINGHTTQYKINGKTVDRMRDFYSDLYQVFGFVPAFTSLKINEVRLMTNPLYALLILDPKELRKLLVAMGCSVSNEELYQMGFEYMRPLELKFGGKWEDVRAVAKDELKAAKDDYKLHESQLQLFNGLSDEALENYRNELAILNKHRNNLVNQRAELNATSDDAVLKDLELQIKAAEIEEQAVINARNLDLDKKIKDLQETLNNTEEQANKQYQEMTKGINEEISKVNTERLNATKTLNEILEQRNPIYKELVDLEVSETRLNNKINEKSDLLAKALTQDNEIECPYCHATFSQNTSGIDIDMLKTEIYQLQQEVQAIGEKKVELKNSIESLDIRANNSRTLVNELLKKSNELNEALSDIEKPKIDVSEINLQISNLILEKSKPVDNPKLAELRLSYQSMVNNAIETKKSKIEQINNEIRGLDEEITNLNIKLNDFSRKEALMSALAQDQATINDKEAWLGKVNSFIHTMIQLINDRAKEITGFDFVMLEENMTNDSLTEVCYALIDGVPFKDLNTADKFKYGIQFLEVARKIASIKTGITNDLPILGDRFESISSIDTIKQYTNQQLICTRVNESGEMRVE